MARASPWVSSSERRGLREGHPGRRHQGRTRETPDPVRAWQARIRSGGRIGVGLGTRACAREESQAGRGGISRGARWIEPTPGQEPARLRGASARGGGSLVDGSAHSMMTAMGARARHPVGSQLVVSFLACDHQSNASFAGLVPVSLHTRSVATRAQVPEMNRESRSCVRASGPHAEAWQIVCPGM